MAIVYRHRRLDTNEIFYVGIGKSIRRAFRKDNRSNFWTNIIKKTNYNVEILYDNLSWDDACELEIFLIDLYGRKNLKTGTLVNLTDGGDGLKNYICTEETKERISTANKGKLPWNKDLKGFLKGRKVSDETKEKLSQSNKGKKHSSLTKNKISSTKKGSTYPSKRKKISQFDLNDNFIKTFDSLTQCSLELNIDFRNISAVANGKRIKTNNFKFKYES